MYYNRALAKASYKKIKISDIDDSMEENKTGTKNREVFGICEEDNGNRIITKNKVSLQFKWEKNWQDY